MTYLNRAMQSASALVLALGLGLPAQADGYRVETLVPGSAFHGVHGLGVDAAGHLFAGSVVGQTLYRVDRDSGAVSVEIPAPQGMADDLAFAPDGTMAWTAFLLGDIYARGADGAVTQLASGLPGINSLAYRDDGRLFATQVFLGDALYEVDPTGRAPARKIMEGMGGLNGFQFGPDGKLYGPLWFKGQVVRVDVETAEIEVIADGFKVPAAVNLDSKGNIWVVDTAQGHLVRVSPDGQRKEIFAHLSTSLDNLAIDAEDHIFVSNMADNGIQQIDPQSGAVRQLVKGALSMPGGLALVSDGGRDTLYVADGFAYRSVDTASGAVTDLARMQADHLEYPFSARANADHVLLSSWFTGTVQVMDRHSGHSLRLLHGFAAPQDALELADGSLLVTELAKGTLTRVTGAEGDTREVVAEGLVLPVGMVPDGQEAVFLTEAGTGTLSRIALADGAKTVIASGLQGPEGLDRAPDGRLVLAEVGTGRVLAIDPAGGEVAVLAEGLPIGMTAAAGMPPTYIPTGVAVGQDGSVYVSADIENAIYRLVPQ
ncbi:Vgb family protein [Pseudodonghicola flavimaris]|uniref:SMP-30/gluconolactonase/LRE family protein n=1 Tax=Pseudodonghicola flavimaris TaxID=3050036 RepID=A0ABT7EZ78_9RHOB|nr:SMP-30/gluconolactonase/LRE family protein [Pseudodonghicola flavimaris]MDK3017555.1 SMP-30/gluconolactonase/LRE family protein [Pseudodonghicola flavimaris]